MKMSHCLNFPRKHTPILSTYHGNSQETQDCTVHAMCLGSTWGLPGTTFIVALLSHVFSSSRLYYSSSSQWGDAEQEWSLSAQPAALQGEKKQQIQPQNGGQRRWYNPDSAIRSLGSHELVSLPLWAPDSVPVPPTHTPCVLGGVQLFVTPCTVARQPSVSMGFSRQEYWSGLPCPPPGDLPDPGLEPTSPPSPALAGRLFTTSATWQVPTWLMG